jgi:zinc transporter ZupT
MSGILADFTFGVLATFVPLFIGLFIPATIANGAAKMKILMAFSCGIMFWFFVDAMNDATLLDVNQGFGGGIAHLLLAGLFAAGLLVLFGLEKFTIHKKRTARNISSILGISYSIALLASLGIGLHSMGEGVEIGSFILYSYLTNSTSNLIAAIGGFGPGVAYVLHKLLEGFVLGVFAALAKARFSRIALLGAVSGISTVIGITLGFSTPINATYFFAIGGAAAVYIEYKLISRIANEKPVLLYVTFTLIGFYCMYLAGLFHG